MQLAVAMHDVRHLTVNNAADDGGRGFNPGVVRAMLSVLSHAAATATTGSTSSPRDWAGIGFERLQWRDRAWGPFVHHADAVGQLCCELLPASTAGLALGAAGRCGWIYSCHNAVYGARHSAAHHSLAGA